MFLKNSEQFLNYNNTSMASILTVSTITVNPIMFRATHLDGN